MPPLNSQSFTLSGSIAGALRTRAPTGGLSGAGASTESGADIAVGSGPGAVAGGSELHSDNFSTNNLAKLFNGQTFWLGTNDSYVSGNELYIDYALNDAYAEQRYTFGASKYSEIYVYQRTRIPADYNHVGGWNWKGMNHFWSNTSGSNTNDGYSQANELLIGTELWPNAANDGGSATSIRVFGNGYDYHVQKSSIGADNNTNGNNFITLADRGTTVEYIMRVRASTVWADPSGLNDAYPRVGNGIFQIWKRPQGASEYTRILSNTQLNAYPPAGWTGFNRGYFFGWRNGTHLPALQWRVREARWATSNIFGVTT